MYQGIQQLLKTSVYLSLPDHLLAAGGNFFFFPVATVATTSRVKHFPYSVGRARRALEQIPKGLPARTIIHEKIKTRWKERQGQLLVLCAITLARCT